MTNYEFEGLYFDWLCHIVNPTNYVKLFRYLHSREFTYSIDMDSNRYEDGIDLRSDFARECGIDSRIVDEYTKRNPCSILEMMIALSNRLEVHIMDNPEYGNRTAKWFWNMIDSLGLSDMVDRKFDLNFVDHVINRFLDRNYCYNGAGGLFTIPNSRKDLREYEIWYQANWYLELVG